MGDDSSIDFSIDSSVEALDQESKGEHREEDPVDPVPPGEEDDVGTVVENRKKAIDRLLDKFEEVCPKSQLGRTRMFKNIRKTVSQ